MNIGAQTTAFTPNVTPEGDRDVEATAEGNDLRREAWMSAILGVVLAGGFYGLILLVPFGPLQRYFLGHPVAVAASVLFWFAAAVLLLKWLGVTAQRKQFAALRDEDLRPTTAHNSPAEQWRQKHDAGHVAQCWLDELAQLPREVRQSQLVTRLSELLTRQSRRGSAKHLSDDLRELSARDADTAHDSLGLVRIIIWAIPMLGFLGTVIGITQTLGGLDFTNGNAAVDNLKSGLYVAFDTTALGLVLSVVAIFLQFPIERQEQRLLAEIDARVGDLISTYLPGDDTSDNQTGLIVELCKGVQAAVAESLENQARLWRETIDEAQHHWQRAGEENHNRIAEAFEQTLIPALQQHADTLSASSAAAGDQLGQQCDRWEDLMQQLQQVVQRSNESAADQFQDAMRSVLTPSLQDHAACLDEAAQMSADRLERQWQQWQESMSYHSDLLSSQQLSLIKQYESLAEMHQQGEVISQLQQTLDNNLLRLAETNTSIDRSISAAAGDGMADAMRILARAVDVLSNRLAQTSGPPSAPDHPSHDETRRAA